MQKSPSNYSKLIENLRTITPQERKRGSYPLSNFRNMDQTPLSLLKQNIINGMISLLKQNIINGMIPNVPKECDVLQANLVQTKDIVLCS